MPQAPRVNHLGQPVGDPLPDWQARPQPPRLPIEGRCCRIEPLEPERHAAALWRAYGADREGRNWTYLPYGPFANEGGFRAWARESSLKDDPLYHAIVERESGDALGVAAYMRIDPPNGVIEVGGINYAPALQRTVAATEAMFLMMRRVFDELGYRRYEWKCDVLNGPSRQAAVRLGFSFEGIFRQAVVTKGRNRDTAWYAVIDQDWPRLKAAFECWLAPGNFDAGGRQRAPLACRIDASA